MRHKAKIVAAASAFLGLVAPAVWFYEFYRGAFDDPTNDIFDRLVRFFPTSVLFLAAPYPDPTGGIITDVIAAIAVALNSLLYAVIGCALLYAISMTIAKVWKRRSGWPN